MNLFALVCEWTSASGGCGQELAIALFLVPLPASVWTVTPVQADAEQGAVVLHLYGPGGPLPAMKEAADTFSKVRALCLDRGAEAVLPHGDSLPEAAVLPRSQDKAHIPDTEMWAVLAAGL
jgi:hypothetical protein